MSAEHVERSTLKRLTAPGAHMGRSPHCCALVPGLFCDGFAVRLDGYTALDRLTRMYGPATRAHAAARALRPGTVLAAGQVP
jgi:hypothetical protein